MSGSATLTTVMSSSSMKIATETAIKVHHLRSTAYLLALQADYSPALYERPGALPAGAIRRRASAQLQVPVDERHDRLPELGRRPGPVGRAVVGEEGVPRTLVHVDFDLLTARLRALAQLLAQRRRGVLVLGSDRRQQGAVQLLGELERRRRPRRRRALIWRGFVDEAAPAVDRGIQSVARAGEQQRVAPAHAEADAADPAAHLGTCAQEVGRSVEVAQYGLIGHREQALHQRRQVAGRRRAAFARVEIHAERHAAEVGEAVGDIADVLVEAAGLVDDDHARVLARVCGPGQIAVHLCAPGAGEGELFAA